VPGLEGGLEEGAGEGENIFLDKFSDGIGSG